MRKCQWGESALDTALGHLQAAGSLLLLSSSAQDITLPQAPAGRRNQQPGSGEHFGSE